MNGAGYLRLPPLDHVAGLLGTDSDRDFGGYVNEDKDIGLQDHDGKHSKNRARHNYAEHSLACGEGQAS